MLEQLDDGVSCDSGQDCLGIKRSRDDLVADNEEGVGGSDFLDILVLSGIEPENVLAVVLHGILAGTHSAAVVAADLCISRTALGCTDVFVLDVDSGCMQTAVVCGIVGTCR